MNVIARAWRTWLFEAFSEWFKCIVDVIGTANRDTANYWDGQSVTNHAVIKGRREEEENVKQESDEV
jgi:hypothetical protein